MSSYPVSTLTSSLGVVGSNYVNITASDITFGEESLRETIKEVREALFVVEPDLEMLKKYDVMKDAYLDYKQKRSALKEAYNKYKMLEKIMTE